MKNIFKIIKIGKPLYPVFSVLSVLILLDALIRQASPLITKMIVDQIQEQVTDGTGNLNRLLMFIGLFFGVNLVSIILNTITMRLGDFLASRLGRFLTERFYKKILTLPQRYFDSELSGKIVNQLTRGILSIQDFSGSASNFILPSLMQGIFGISILSYYSPTIGLLSLMIFPIYIGISHYSTKMWGKREVEKNKFEDAARGRIQEVISNIKLVKSFNTQLKEWSFVSDSYHSINTIYDKQSWTYHLFNLSRNFAFEIALFMIMVITFRNTFTGVFTLGEMVLIIQILAQLRWPLFGMSFILERIQRAEAGSKEYFDIMELESVESLRSKGSYRTFKNPSLAFEDVSFRYDESGEVLSDINFQLNPKETVALVGHSGAGKSTIINLILKFYETTSGTIKISGHDYKELKHQDIRHNISLVFQENELFSTTIRENVAYGMKNASDKEIIAALKKANAYDFVKKFPEGLDSQVGERGVKLSGGQKQRIQIARAIMHDAPILILDEATSSLDSKSEKLVQDALDNLFKNRLVIIIAHRFSTIQNADRILVIDGGTIVDSGASKDLAKKSGIYSELLRYQIEGNQKLLEQYDIFGQG